MRLAYFGSGAFGLPTFERLLGEHEIALVVSQPDRPAGRHRRLTPTPIAARAEAAGIPILKPERVNEPAITAAIRAAADVFVVIAYGQKLGPDLLDGAFAINLHGSLLPAYRGAAPINRAMMAGERETGVSVITLAATMDAGAVLARRAVEIDPTETAGDLHDRLADLGPDAVAEVLRGHAAGTLAPEEQDPAAVTQAPKLRKDEGTVSFDQSAARVRARIHGLTPWPGCTVRLGGARLKLLQVRDVPGDECADETGPPPGALAPDGTVTCRPGRVRLLRVQPAGKRPMDYEAFHRGHDVEDGAVLEPLVSTVG